jgi:putative Mg2+ transporter-C (MgtC) family protein
MGVIQYIESWNNVSIVLRLFLATFFGGLIGLERSVQKHSTGIRTFALVSLGAALAVMINLYLGRLEGVTADAGRIPAQVVNGIGFLGAGSILVTGRNQIKGLTTAASLWATAMMGMALGAGFILAAGTSFILILLANKVLQYVSHHVEEYNKFMSLYFEVDKDQGIIRLRDELQAMGYQIISINKTKQKPLNATDVVVMIDLNLEKKQSHREVMNQLSSLSYINYIEEI